MAGKRTYTGAFKLPGVELAPSGQKSINEIERDLGITPGLLHKWKAGMQVKGAQAFPGKGRRPDEEERIRQRKREVELLRTAAIF
jgi:transposase-like protein